MSQQPTSGSQGSNGIGDGWLPDDPRGLLQVYPIATYTPTARVAEHFSPHTTIHRDAVTPASLHPEYVEHFNQVDNPQTEEDWRLRANDEDRLKELLTHGQQQGYTYSTFPYPSPGSSSDIDRVPTQQQPPPMPYSFMPSFNQAQAYRDPPTPSSLPDTNPSPPRADTSRDYIDKLVDGILSRAPSRPSGGQTTPTKTSQNGHRANAVTPTITRTLANTTIGTIEESPDPLALPGPSPSKRAKHAAKRAEINHGNYSTNQSTTTSSTANHKRRPSSDGHTGTKRPVPEVGMSSKTGSSSQATGTHKSQFSDDEDEDELDWGDGGHQDGDRDWDMEDSAFRSPSPRKGIPEVGSGRTGERDRRTGFQKLQTLLDDIGEAFDSLPADVSADSLASSRYFSAISDIGQFPLLSSRALSKLTEYATRVKSKKRVHGEDWDLDAFSRVLRLVERAMRQGDNLPAFGETRTAAAHTKAKKGKKTSQSPDLDNKDPSNSLTSTLTDEQSRALESDMRKLADAGSAAVCVLTLLDLDGLPKQIYSEEIISLAVSLLKQISTRLVFPLLASQTGESSNLVHISSLLQSELLAQQPSSAGSASAAFVNPSLNQMIRGINHGVPRIASLISRPDVSFSDSLVIQTVYLAIAPLLVSEPSTKKKGKTAAKAPGATGSMLKNLKMEAMSCLRMTFAKSESQRQWIIEEILSAMIKVPDQTGPRMRFQLAGGSSIHLMSALLLQLLQASGHGVIARVRKLRARALDAEVMEAGTEKPDVAQEEANICSSAIESVFQTARTVAAYLFQRASTSKANKTSLDTDYKAVLDTLVADLLVVLYRPEWPAASLFLNVIARLMMNALEDTKTGSDGSTAKSIALDHLGDVAAKLRAVNTKLYDKPVPTLDEVVSSIDVDGLKTLKAAQLNIDNYLATSAEADDMFASARDINCVIYCQELQTATKKLQSISDKLAEADDHDEDAIASREKLPILSQALKAASRDVWQDSEDLFMAKDPRQSEIALQGSIALSRSRPLQSAFEPILRALSISMDSSVVGIRSKALRALSSIVTIDPDILTLPFVKQALEDRLADTSPAVRDAAVELVGKYIVQKPSLATEYYPLISTRVTDPGVSVRKRVTKLLVGIFATTTDKVIRTDICCRLIDTMGDQDDNIKAMATKALAEILFHIGASGFESNLLIEVLAEYTGSWKSFVQAIQMLAPEVRDSTARFATAVEDTVTKMVDATEQPDFDPLIHIKAIGALCAIEPSLIDTSRAFVLLSYLRPAVNADNQAINSAVLKILKRSIPTMPRVTSNFATELVSTLNQMIQKPTGGLASLPELVACLSAAVSHLTRDYSPIYKVLKACEARLRNVRAVYAQTPPQADKTAPTALMLYITALIVEHCNFDLLAEEDDAIHREIRGITELRLPEYFFDMYLDFSRYPIFQNAPSLCLGSLFHAYPALILREEATEWMDQVFKSSDYEGQAGLLKVIHDFLVSEAEKRAAGKVDPDIKALIGSSQDLTESGVSTSVVQRNINAILQGARSSYPPLQDAALEVLTFTVKQGLHHPLQSMPILIALETSEEPLVAEQALSLHAHLHTKHASLVTIRYLEFARASYDYQRTITAEPFGHRQGQALLQGWYGLISEKRTWRLDFLRSFIRAFDYDLSKKEIPNVGLVLYLADNLATLEYKIQDEPMSVVHLLGTVINSCTHLASILESGAIEGGPEEPIAGKNVVISGSGEAVSAEVAINASLVVCIALITKNHILSNWSLSEDKCLKHNPGKKSAMGDRPAIRKGIMALDVSRLPLVRGVETCAEYASQAATFLQMLNEDGSISER